MREALPQSVRKRRDEVGIGPTSVDSSVDYGHDTYAAYGLDNSFTLEAFQRECRVINFTEATDGDENACEFELVGVDAPVANALRRMMLARVPTMAIDVVTVLANSSVIPDEVLVHRVGLVPLRAPAKHFAYPPQALMDLAPTVLTGELPSVDEGQALKYSLHVECTFENGEEKNSLVRSGDLKWVPSGEQGAVYTEDSVGPVHDNIVIARLAPGQSIKLDCLAVKGRGELHAKWSPVSTAFYRLKPIVRILEPIAGRDAEALRDLCPKKVFDIEDGAAVVAHAQACSVCRECTRNEVWGSRIELAREKRHFLFRVESTGAYAASDIFVEAIKELKNTLAGVNKQLNEFIAHKSE